MNSFLAVAWQSGQSILLIIFSKISDHFAMQQQENYSSYTNLFVQMLLAYYSIDHFGHGGLSKYQLHIVRKIFWPLCHAAARKLFVMYQSLYTDVISVLLSIGTANFKSLGTIVEELQRFKDW